VTQLIVVNTRRKARTVDQETQTDTELVTETLVEEVSIDGMCGVY
jgi:mycofactocin precursor peptide MftA